MIADIEAVYKKYYANIHWHYALITDDISNH